MPDCYNGEHFHYLKMSLPHCIYTDLLPNNHYNTVMLIILLIVMLIAVITQIV